MLNRPREEGGREATEKEVLVMGLFEKRDVVMEGNDEDDAIEKDSKEEERDDESTSGVVDEDDDDDASEPKDLRPMPAFGAIEGALVANEEFDGDINEVVADGRLAEERAREAEAIVDRAMEGRGEDDEIRGIDDRETSTDF